MHRLKCVSVFVVMLLIIPFSCTCRSAVVSTPDETDTESAYNLETAQPIELPGEPESIAASTPSPSPTPALPDFELLSKNVIEAFFSELDFYPALNDAPHSRGYQHILSEIEAYRNIIEALIFDMEQASQVAIENSAMLTDYEINSDFWLQSVSWKYISAYLLFSDSSGVDRTIAAETLKNSLKAEAAAVFNENDTILLSLVVEFPRFSDLSALLAPYIDEARLGGKLAYAYLMTVYDEEGAEIPFVQPEPEGNLITGLTMPLEQTDFRDGWYDPRDQGTRKHTGTDIYAPVNTPIYSCTSGTVLHIGTGPGTGNYVVIRDEYDYEFIYIHMVRLTDFLSEGDAVQAGDVIGHVGNTGTGGYHLHISIISASGAYINPYPYLREATESARQ